jgi:hypothetical protein
MTSGTWLVHTQPAMETAVTGLDTLEGLALDARTLCDAVPLMERLARE